MRNKIGEVERIKKKKIYLYYNIRVFVFYDDKSRDVRAHVHIPTGNKIII